MKRTHGLFIACALAMTSAGCKPTPDPTHVLEGKVTDARNGSGVSDVEVRLERTVVENGVLQGIPEVAGMLETDNEGEYELAFPHALALEYDVYFEKDKWFDATSGVHPDEFIEADEVEVDMVLHPKGWVVTRIVQVAPVDSFGEISFRFLVPPYELPIEPNTWSSYSGPELDTVRTALFEGDTWAPYVYTITSEGGWSETVDSVFVMAFDTAAVVIEW